MKCGINRTICLVFALVLLLSFVACGGGKKDQVVHEGETVKYGDMDLTYKKSVIGYIESHDNMDDMMDVYLNISCSYHGDDSFIFSQFKFDAYADGKEIREKGVNGYGNVPSECQEYGYTSDKEIASIPSGRSSDIWIARSVPFDTKTVEFDYMNDKYSRQWGKVTFVVDISQNYKPKNDWVVGTWTYTITETRLDSILTHTWTSIDLSQYEYVFEKGGTGYYTYTVYDDENQQVNKTFTYKYLSEDFVLLTYENGDYELGHYNQDLEVLSLPTCYWLQKLME